MSGQGTADDIRCKSIIYPSFAIPENHVRAIPVRLVLALVASALASAAHGQTYPSRPITMIVPYAAGGSVDAVARIIVPPLSERLGQSVVIENVAGAGGVV